MPHIVGAFVWKKEGACGRDQVNDLVEGAGTRGAHEGFEFREGLFDGIEVGAVRRQKAELCADGFDRRPDLRLLVDGQVVDHDDVARAEGGDENLLDVGQETDAVDRAVEDGRGVESGGPQRGQHGVRLPMPAGRVIVEPHAARTPPVAAEQVGRHPALVEEHIAIGLAKRLAVAPLAPRGGHISPALLVSVYRFF